MFSVKCVVTVLTELACIHLILSLVSVKTFFKRVAAVMYCPTGQMHQMVTG